jgi:hypothetical protein
MGHSWDIREPSCFTLRKRGARKSPLFHRVAQYSCGHLSLFYTLEELKKFEKAGYSIWFDRTERSDWSELWEEIEKTQSKSFDTLNKGQTTIDGITFIQI